MTGRPTVQRPRFTSQILEPFASSDPDLAGSVVGHRSITGHHRMMSWLSRQCCLDKQRFLSGAFQVNDPQHSCCKAAIVGHPAGDWMLMYQIPSSPGGFGMTRQLRLRPCCLKLGLCTQARILPPTCSCPPAYKKVYLVCMLAQILLGSGRCIEMIADSTWRHAQASSDCEIENIGS